MNGLLRIFASRKMGALTLLGFASGLPLVLTTSTLQAWMKQRGVDLGTIGLFQLVTLPYVLKFLWAPVMDRFVPPLLGRRRGWLIVTQILVILSILGLAAYGEAPMGTVFAAAMLVAFCSASQDIVADAYRTDILEPDERGAGAALFVTGYRIAMLATGLGTFALVGTGWISWPMAYVLTAACLSIGLVGTFIAPEPQTPGNAPQSLYEATVPPFLDFIARPDGWLVLAFVLLFRLPDTIANTMTVPFLLSIDVSNTEIGVIRNGFGLGMTIIGALGGGLVVNRLGLIRSLWIAGLLQAASNAGFFILSNTGNDTSVLMAVMLVENFCGGVAVAAFFAFLMSQCSRMYSATQYALLSSLMAGAGLILGSQTGFWAIKWGWELFFAVSVLAAIPGMLLLFWVRPREESDQDPDPRGFEIGTTNASKVGLDS
jgi:PAT family beta-lactamase induction signal transducer AmpG